MSYEVDPNLKPPEEGGKPHRRDCAKLGEELIECMELSRQKVCKVRIRKVNVDLEIEDESDECPD
ncbi:MAG TPA: hypothetical protein VFO40_20405 [Chthoniobacterales bacterium]|nr:hypothetical protein [Chthoniobacterales bacterium]